MKYGVIFGHGLSDGVGFPDYVIPAARTAEQLGFESVWIGEHAVIPKHDTPYPFTPDGSLPFPHETPIPDPLIWLAYVAGATESINLGAGAVILPQRQALLLAKETATLDALSGGRLLLGVGAGWLPEESEALGVPFARRGARLDEHITTLRRVWREAAPTIDGEFTQVEEAVSYPKPARPGGPPVIICGASVAAAKRAGRLADGFYPMVGSPQELPPLIDLVRTAAREAGRDPADIEITVGSFTLATDQLFTDAAIEDVRGYQDAGVDRLVLFRTDDITVDDITRSMDHFMNKVASEVS
ncbi:LLM class F420-dependent oxidoreductase [Rhodococcoides yunnanense]|uniref:LLM class F420-dependent oxidoreductase n=1 Tax=Rhodococcoides yunnanense TaxID=278209 RepID=UPI00093495BB|nr:LLM class F420-dependent oxidoreductase [Rhodococcus yunnanensis]